MLEPYDVLKAAENARCAIRRGDLIAAERWMRIAERATRITQALTDMENAAKREISPWAQYNKA